ncbi:MAG: DUF4129 domain-containing protein [Gemmatimonadaceae bacterium]
MRVVFSAPAYNRISVAERLINAVMELLSRLFALFPGRTSPFAYWGAIAVVAILLLAMIVRAGYLAHLQREASRTPLRFPSTGRDGGKDAWLSAQELAAQGNFTDAAHALYAALLDSAARRDQLRIHPSKTVGDYVRELRGRSSSLFTRFREFARSYETVIYGLGFCDRERYERLRALALPLVQLRD